jgi:pimeloyl-ACP methyl ester carboxylesterase
MVMFAGVETRFETSQVTVSGDVRLNYVHGGPQDGPAVIMLHGYSDSSFSFSRVLPLMPPHLRVIAVDQRGHGDSSRPANGYTMWHLAGDVLGLMDALSIGSATVVGHSMGSFVARAVSERAKERVWRLVLIGTALYSRNAATGALAGMVEGLTDPVDESFIREFQRSTIARPVPPEFFERVVSESKKVPARIWQAALDGLLSYRPQWPIACPTTLLGGELDSVFSAEEQASLFLATEHSTLHLEPGVGHTLHWEMPERFVSLAFPTPPHHSTGPKSPGR